MTEDRETTRPRGDPCPPRVAKAIVGALLEAGTLIFTPHCRRHMDERDFDGNDVKFILCKGDYEKFPPAWKPEYEEYWYFAVGADLSGKRLKVIFAFKEQNRAVVIIGGERYYKGKRV